MDIRRTMLRRLEIQLPASVFRSSACEHNKGTDITFTPYSPHPQNDKPEPYVGRHDERLHCLADRGYTAPSYREPSLELVLSRTPPEAVLPATRCPLFGTDTSTPLWR